MKTGFHLLGKALLRYVNFCTSETLTLHIISLHQLSLNHLIINNGDLDENVGLPYNCNTLFKFFYLGRLVKQHVIHIIRFINIAA